MTRSIPLASPSNIEVRGVDGGPALGPRELAKAGFFDANRHGEALALLSADALRSGRPEAAFLFADRRCRLAAPTVYDLILRATASRLMSETAYAENDLARAFEIDPTHELVLWNALAWGAPALQHAAAVSLLDGESDDRESLRLAMRAFESAGTPIVSRMHDREGMHVGWVAWRGEGALGLIIRRGGIATTFELECDVAHPLANRIWSAAQISIEIESPRLQSVTFRLDDTQVHTVFPAQGRPEAPRHLAIPSSFRRRSEAPEHVAVIVPVYEDYAATKACLDSLEAEGSRIARRVTVIDDCSPNAQIRALLDDRAARGLFELVRNEENLGFARSVNWVLERDARGDVLLLNADANLPMGAIDRLSMAAHSEAGIATVTPLSNNGELTSFPRPNVYNALPPREEIGALDAAACAANGPEIVDLPTGVGFCLYITRACLEAVGPLSEDYSRGYYEDVDYCLRAREIGFRNVCATGVYVGHAGSRSFGTEKRRLVVRNLKTLNERFPEHERDCAAFVRADPLRAARAKIEEQLPPEGCIVLVLAPGVSGRALALERARQIEVQGCDLHCLYCEVDDGKDCITVKSTRESAPQSLTFTFADGRDLARLQAYLTRLHPQRIEVLAPHALPDAALRLAFGLQVPIRLALGDLDWMCDRAFVFGRPCSDTDRPGDCHACAHPCGPTTQLGETRRADNRCRTRVAIGKAESIVPMDRMAAAFCAANLKSTTLATSASWQRPRLGSVKAKPPGIVLGVLCPEPTAETDRQILALEQLLDQQGVQASIVVLGQCVDELGVMARRRIFVTGVMDEDELERGIRQCRITHFLSPYRTRHFGLVDRLAAAFGLAKGYFDWSFGALDRKAGDLALDPRICFERAALEIGVWIADSSTGFLSRVD